MSVLIKGMDMPSCCDGCSFSDWHNLHQTVCCKMRDYEPCFADYSREYEEKRSNDCPLVEIPTPHGDLIDRDALDARVRQAGGMGNVEEECTEDFNDGVLFVLDYFVKNAPTIIEAKGSEDG